MLARLLRKTIGALNTSSEMVMDSNNMRERRAESGLEQLRGGGAPGSFRGVPRGALRAGNVRWTPSC